MNISVLLILPTQLFNLTNRFINKYDKTVIIKENYYINNNIHLTKLEMHNRSCDEYYNNLKHKNKFILDTYKSNKNENCYMFHPTDKYIVDKYNFCEYLDSPGFIIKIGDIDRYYTNKQNIFYQKIRTDLDVLMHNNRPFGNKWSYDNENRHKYPENYIEDKKQIESSFPPISRNEALTLLKNFVKFKLSSFGFFQDSIKKEVLIGFHSYLSAPLNIGLITPDDIIKEVMKYDIPLNSLEGFIRQLIGWREFIRMHYIVNGDQDFKYLNNMNKKLPISWYTGDKTGLDVLDWSISRVLQYGYVPHIERLMLLNNIALLLQIEYFEIKRWFTNMFIDGYDWAMLNVSMNTNYLNPNKNLKFMSKVYLTNGTYLKKMGLEISKRDMEQIQILYKKFIVQNKDLLKKDYRMSAYIKNNLK